MMKEAICLLAASIVAGLVVVFGLYTMAALLVRTVVAGLFELSLPFWPTMVAIFLVNLFLAILFYFLKKWQYEMRRATRVVASEARGMVPKIETSGGQCLAEKKLSF
jgi:hypothetical protein